MAAQPECYVAEDSTPLELEKVKLILVNATSSSASIAPSSYARAVYKLMRQQDPQTKTEKNIQKMIYKQQDQN